MPSNNISSLIGDKEFQSKITVLKRGNGGGGGRKKLSFIVSYDLVLAINNENTCFRPQKEP